MPNGVKPVTTTSTLAEQTVLHDSVDLDARNPHSPFYCLAEDIIIEIISHCVPTSPWDDHTGMKQVRHFLWLSHVCSEWRRVMLETSGFWTHLMCPTPALTWMFLERARNLPLTLHVNHNLYFSAQDEKRLLDLLPRAEHLDVYLTHHWTDARRRAVLDALSTAEVPLLKTFSFDPRDYTGLLIVPFRCHTPNIRTFWLTSCTMPQGWRFYNTLDSLYMSNVTSLSGSDFIAALSELTLLTRLCFQGELLHDAVDSRGAELIAVIPHLKRVEVRVVDDPDQLLFFARHVECPEVKTLFLSGHGIWQPATLAQIARTTLVTSFFERVPHGDMVASLRGEYDFWHSALISVYSGASLPSEIVGMSKLVFELEATSKTALPTACLRALVEEFQYPHLHIQQVTLKDVTGHSKDFWTHLFEAHAESIREVRVSTATNVAGFMVAWKDAEVSKGHKDLEPASNEPPPVNVRGSHQPPMRLALLSSIWIDTSMLTRAQTTEGDRLVDVLTAALTARAQSGRPSLDLITFKGYCGVDQAFCEGLLKTEAVREVKNTHMGSDSPINVSDTT